MSARTGAGLEELRGALERAAARASSRAGRRPLRLHVDRVFSVRGAGTVVTGTLWSGVAEQGAEVTVLPRGTGARVRGVQVHDEPVERAAGGPARRAEPGGSGARRGRAGRRDRGAARRARRGRPTCVTQSRGPACADFVGQSPTTRARATYRVDVALTWATPDARPDSGARVGVHHGTRESAARLVELGGRFFQLRLEEPIVPAAGDRLVIRSLRRRTRSAAASCSIPRPRRHGPSRDLLARLARLERGEPEPEAPPRAAGARSRSAPRSPRGARARAAPQGRRPRAAARRRPREPGAPPRARPRGPARTDDARPSRRARRGPRPRRRADRADGEITLAQLRDELDTSRKYAQAYLEHFDATKVTLRRGEAHVLRKRRPRT